jgi:hypothetical protein
MMPSVVSPRRTTAQCEHEGFHSATTRYDRGAGVLRFVLTCDRCGATVQEVRRVAYRPQLTLYRNPPIAA